ncbi:MAG TPA: hypothetical protein VGM77_05905 [Gemmatimonadales bacterium]|jgi:hypothetical protein
MSHRLVTRLLLVGAAGASSLAAQSLPVRQAVVDTVVHGQIAHLSKLTLFDVGPDGAIALTPRPDQPVALYDGDSLVARFQPTKPPGDEVPFRVAGLGWVGDSVWIRVGTVATIYSRQGEPGRPIALELTVHGPPGGRTIAHEGNDLIKRAPLQAVYPNGGLLMREMAGWVLSSVPAAAGGATLFLRVSDHGAFVRTVGLGYSGDAQCRMAFYPSGAVIRPFCPLPRAQASPGGAMVASLLATADTKTVHIVVVSERGDTAWQRDLALPTVPVLSRERDSAIADLGRKYAVSPMPGFADSAVSVLRHNPVTTHAPVVRLLVGDDGSAWLDLYTRDHHHQWLVIHADGQVAGVVTVPATTTLVEVRGDAAWGLDTTGDVVNLLRYTVGPPIVP